MRASFYPPSVTVFPQPDCFQAFGIKRYTLVRQRSSLADEFPSSLCDNQPSSMAQSPLTTPIPPIGADGYLPEGVHVCSEDDVISRCGSSSRHRRRLALRLRRWIELGRQVGAKRLLVDGSFVTAKEEPQDLDTVLLLPQDFTQQLEQEHPPALELEEMLLTRRPEEIFAAEDETDWEEWVAFFSLTRELDGRRKGLVEIPL